MPMRTPDESTGDDEPVAAGGAAPSRKLQRWIDLLAALLSRNAAVTFDQLIRDVPEYWNAMEEAREIPDEKLRKTKIDSLKRTFERDKDELRDFGIPIESEEDEDGNPNAAYRVRRKNFYLPYLFLAAPHGDATRPQKVDRFGYRALTSLTFDPDELQAVVEAASAVRSLGDPVLATEADSALRKLAVDLPIDHALASPDRPRVLLARARPDARTFETLGDALRRRKTVTFDYHAMQNDRTESRAVEPYGLFFLNAHWYLAARDRERDDLRNFRLSRMSAVKVNGVRAQSSDFEIPASFRLREHARSRHAWELGDGEATAVKVRVAGASGATMAAMRLGASVDNDPTLRNFAVRRMDAFVRWLLSFGGELVPVEPAATRQQYRDAIAATAVAYTSNDSREAGAREVSPAITAARPGARSDQPWQPKGAAAQLRRILHVVPEIADGEEHSLADVAARIGTSVDVLQNDLYSLVTRYDVPGGFVEGVQLYVETDRVSARSDHLLRPMRLTVSELCALDLGLAVLLTGRAPDEHAALDRARVRLQSVISQLPGDPLSDAFRGATLDASIGDHGDTAHLAEIRIALRQRRKLQLTYRKSGSVAAGERVVCPCALVAASGMLYIVAHCESDEGVRVFRMDRVEAAKATNESFERPTDFSLDSVLRDGRVFQRESPEMMRVHYSPRIARWIAEREGRSLAPDGSLVMEHPLADVDWGVRHVLQYAHDAEVLAPESLRDELRARLIAMTSTLDNIA